MRDLLSLSVFAAVFAGTSFGLVTAIEGALSKSIGPLNASFIENMAAGLISTVAFLVLFTRRPVSWAAVRPVLPAVVIAGVLVIAAVVGIAYALPRIGVGAGNVALVFGQIAIAFLIDSVGVGGFERIPLNLGRIAGLAFMAVGVYLVLPRGG